MGIQTAATSRGKDEAAAAFDGIAAGGLRVTDDANTAQRTDRRLKRLGFDGPYSGGKHDFMRRASDQLKLALPRDDAKSREIGVELQKRILHEIGVSTKNWTNT